MENQSLEAAIKSDLITVKMLRMELVSGRDYYFSILAWIFKLSLLFLSVNILLQHFMHVVGYYHARLSLKGLVITWICALLASTFMSFTAARIILIGKMIKGQLKTATLIRSKYLRFTLVFFLIYSLAYLVITYPVLGWMDLSEFQQADEELWFSFIYVGFPQFSAFLVASVAIGFISMIELDRLGLGPLFNVIIDKLKNNENQSAIEEQE